MSPIRTGILVLVLAALPAASHGQTAAPVDAFQCNAGVDYAMQITGYVQTGVLDYASGLPKANECVRLFPADATVFGKRSQVHWGLGDLDSAVADLTKAAELTPGSSRWLTRRGDVRAEAEQDELALADYEAALRVDATDSMALLGRAHVRRYLGDLTGSIRDFDTVLARIDEDDAVYLYAQLAYQGLGFARLANGEPGLAIAAFTQSLERDEYLEQSWYGRAQAHEQAGDRAAAVADLTQLLDRFDPDAHYFERRGNLNLDLGNREAGIADLREAVRLDPNLTAVRDRLADLEPTSEADFLRTAQTAFNGGRLDDALNAYNEAIRLNSSSAEAYLGRGSIHFRQDRIDLAEADYERAIALAPDNAAGYSARAAVRTQQDRLEEAVADLTRSIELSPGDALNQSMTYSSRADLLARLGRNDEALADYTQAIEWANKDSFVGRILLPTALAARARHHRTMGNWDAALTDARAAAALPRADDTVRALVAEIEAGKPTLTAEQYAAEGRRLGTQGDLAGALTAFGECIRLKPEESGCWAFRGSVRGMQGDLDGADDDFDEALRLNPQEPGIYGIRGMMFAQIGRRDDAISDFRQVLSMDPNNRMAQQALQRLGVGR